MSDLTPEQFATRVVDLGLADPQAVEQIRSSLGTGEHTIRDIATAFQRKGLLTNLHVEKILRGDRVGYWFGDYKILYLIGAGTFARVYRAEHKETGQVFAVKVLRKRFRDQMQELEQFLREARVGIRLRHPNIVSIYHVDPDVRNPFMVMEFVEGQTLRELMKVRKKLPALVSLRLTADMLSGLAYANTQGVTHRDLKMSNVLITSEGKAKLVDFGLAALSDPKNDRAVADCPNARAIDYAALERGTNARNGDPRSDIYFLGSMLYTMLSGARPLTETRDRLQRLSVSRFQEVKPILQIDRSIHGQAAQIVTKSMQFNPDERFQSAGEMLAEVKSAIDAIEHPERAGARGGGGGGLAPEEEGRGRTIMVVEGKAELQNVLRERLKSKGYRVLVLSDPDRALGRFAPGLDLPADCVLFSSIELGSEVIHAFNKFATDEHTAEVPAIFLADGKHEDLIQQLKLAPHRVLLSMPLKVKELRVALLKLLMDRPKMGV